MDCEADAFWMKECIDVRLALSYITLIRQLNLLIEKIAHFQIGN